MKGTAILFQEQGITFIENIDHAFYEKVKKLCGCKYGSSELNEKLVEFNSVSPVFWHEDDIDWDYGY